MNKLIKYIKNLQLTTYNIQHRGLTLIELLVVITLVAIIGTITTQVFILSFKAQTKSESLKEVKQSGDYTMSVLEDMVRNSADIQYDCSNTPLNNLTVQNQDGLITKFVCDTDAGGKKYIASISGWSDAVPSPTGMTLVGSRVTLSQCNIFRVVCPTPALSPKYVFVNFTMENYIPGITPSAGNQVSLDYQTTISLRNYQ